MQDSGSTIRIAYREDGSGGPWNIFRRTDGGPTITPSTEGAGEQLGQREETDEVLLSAEVGGTISFNFSAQTFDDFIAAACANDWDAETGQVVAGGLQDKAFEVLVSYQRINKHVLMKGMRVSVLGLTVEAGARITGSIDFVGTGYEGTYDPSGDTFNDPTTTPVMTAAVNGGDVLIDGAVLDGTCISTYSISLDNSYSAQMCIGRVTAGRQVIGDLNATGNIEFAFTADGFDLWQHTLTRVPITTDFSMSDGTTTYRIETSKTFLNGELPTPSGSDPVTATLDAQYRKSIEAGYSVRFTRTPVDAEAQASTSSLVIPEPQEDEESAA
ncbi:phage tail tube protein [Halomonas sp. 86]|uniref:phage tail tube protein n=1 Tax=unclassified Halomonas TaxID=2609666 RepID=UPI0040345160